MREKKRGGIGGSEGIEALHLRVRGNYGGQIQGGAVPP